MSAVAVANIEPAAETTVPATPFELERRIIRANSLIYLLASALSYELLISDTHKKRGESTACGIGDLETDVREGLAALL